MNNYKLWSYLQKIAGLACSEFALRLNLLFEWPSDEEERNTYGRCYEDRRVELRIHRYGVPDRLLSRRVIVDTLAHELAHLQEWRHGEAHRKLTERIKEFWRERGLV